MASSSTYRTSSLNSFFGTPTAKASSFKARSTSSHHRNLNTGVDMTKKVVLRPVTSSYSPLYSPASEAHIHRIRSANSRSDLKQQCKMMSTALTTFNDGENKMRDSSLLPFPTRLPSIAEDDEDVESLDWAAPFDITSYLYKPEFVIQPTPEKAKSSSDNDCEIEKSLFEAQIDSRIEAWLLDDTKPSPPICLDAENKDDISIMAKPDGSDESVCKTAPRSVTRGSSRVSLLDKELPHYTEFIKNLNSEIKDLARETKRMEIYSPRASKKAETREEVIERGYSTLKWLYELNPALTDFAAKKQICGPPGNQWMGLSRDDIVEIMSRIRTEFGHPQKYYKGVPKSRPKRIARITKDSQVEKSVGVGKKRIGKKQKDGEQKLRPKRPSAPKLKASQLPIQHVPGPKHLHTNVCIRPWEPTWDGWSQDDDESFDEELYHYEECSQKLMGCSSNNNEKQELVFLEADDDETVPDFNQAQNDIIIEEQQDRKETVKESSQEYLTLEVCNPTYRVQR